MDDRSPEVSVVMAVYNGEKYISGAIQSILDQGFNDFEFFIIDDGSTDDTAEILDRYANQDERIQVITQDNTGLTKALNRGVNASKGAFIARQDADDTSFPDRLEKQFSYLKENLETVVIGSGAYIGPFTSNRKHGRDVRKIDISVENPLAHSSVMFRKHIFEKCGGYNERFSVSQDFELWNRMAEYGEIRMFEKPLVTRRMEADGISRKRVKEQVIAAARIRWRYRRGNPLKALSLICWLSLRHTIISAMPLKIVKSFYRFSSGKTP